MRFCRFSKNTLAILIDEKVLLLQGEKPVMFKLYGTLSFQLKFKTLD